MTAPLTDGHLDEIEALLPTVFSDPWRVVHDPKGFAVVMDNALPVASISYNVEELAPFIAAAPHIVTDLLAEVRRLRAENEQLADLDAAATRRAEFQAERDRAVQWWHDEHKRAGKAEAERDDLRARIGNARMEIAAQSAARHVAACGSPVGSVVERVLAKVETHLVDPQYRLVAAPEGVDRPAENPPKSDYSSTTFERTEP